MMTTRRKRANEGIDETNGADFAGPEAAVERPHETLVLPAVTDEHSAVAPADVPPVEPQFEGLDDPDEEATVLRETVQPSQPSQPSTSRPRKTTLATAIVRPRPQAQPDVTPADLPELADVQPEADGIPDEIDEWSIADQPTIQLPPRMARLRSDFLETDEHASWPSRPAASSVPMPTPTPTPPPPTHRPPVPPSTPRREPIARPAEIRGPRLSGPNGRTVPAAPAGVPRAALLDPRMERFQELRRNRTDPESPDDARPVTEAVRQWWTDLRPGLQRALHHQHEARTSGTFPIPAYEPDPASRLGDAFGRLAASARGLTEKAQAVAAPTFKRLHNQAEQAAQALVERFEGSPMRQQEPFLGPGRIAIFFRSGVTVGQAQRLLSASQARPMRIIPRKHGFLAYVKPGFEVEISERLRLHPYVRDVLYVEYDEYGDSVEADEEEEMP
jgi:hypothetical protein